MVLLLFLLLLLGSERTLARLAWGSELEVEGRDRRTDRRADRNRQIYSGKRLQHLESRSMDFLYLPIQH